MEQLATIGPWAAVLLMIVRETVLLSAIRRDLREYVDRLERILERAP